MHVRLFPQDTDEFARSQAMGMMNRQMNLPQIQKIMREFERESETMDLKEEMMSDAVDEVMDDDAEGIGEEEEGDAILKEVLDEIGVTLGQQVSFPHYIFAVSSLLTSLRNVLSSEKRRPHPSMPPAQHQQRAWRLEREWARQAAALLVPVR